MASPVEERFVKENLSGSTVFEFGCAPGKLAIELSKDNYDVVGMDLYDIYSSEGFVFVKGDLIDTHFNCFFENVIAVSSFEHSGIETANFLDSDKSDIQYHYLVANRLIKLVSYNGLLIVTVPFGDGKTYYVDKDGNNGTREEIDTPAWGYRTFNRESICGIFNTMDLYKCEVYEKVEEEYFDMESWKELDNFETNFNLYNNKSRAVMCCVFKQKGITMSSGWGDGISWDNHVDEVLQEKQIIHIINKEKFEITENIKKYLKPKNDKYTLADCGCHVGRWARGFIDLGFDYTGIDQSEKALTEARRLIPDGKFVKSFLWNMMYREEFDIAVTFAVLQHNLLAEQELIIDRIYDMLVPGGVLFITESTVKETTRSQRTYDGWIKMVEKHGFVFKESFHINDVGDHDHYIFQKEKK